MIVYFDSDDLQKLYQIPLSELRGKKSYPYEVINQYKKKVQLLISIQNLEDLKQFRGLNFERLKGNRKGQYSIRLNNQYRLLLTRITESKVQIVLINEISKHYE